MGPKRRRVGPIVERLAVEHADARIALDFRSPVELLISVMLSAQTTDVNVNRVTAHLFEKYRRPEDYLAVPVEELERDLVKLVPRADWGRFPHLLIWHGRRICDARRPRCEDCVVNDLCPSARVWTAADAGGRIGTPPNRGGGR